MNFQLPVKDLVPVVHGALLRLIKGQREEVPEASENELLQNPQETPGPELEQVRPLQSRRPWSGVPLIEMVPLEYRPRVAEILKRDSNACYIIEARKLGVIDCWEAIERLLDAEESCGYG